MSSRREGKRGSSFISRSRALLESGEERGRGKGRGTNQGTASMEWEGLRTASSDSLLTALYRKKARKGPSRGPRRVWEARVGRGKLVRKPFFRGDHGVTGGRFISEKGKIGKKRARVLEQGPAKAAEEHWGGRTPGKKSHDGVGS